MGLLVGDEVGSYRIVGIVGRGATGVVFRVEHLVTKQVEAMKVLGGEMTADQDRVRRFLREIQVQARLNHPNLVSVHNAFFEGQVLCLVMQWVDGEPLSRRIAAGKIPSIQAVDIACQVLSALAHAHQHGVIHRDVKPANILIDRNGQAKLTDFGLARPCADLDVSLEGVALGSVHYMPPEQVRGLPTADARADLYSAGVVLYEMLTGRKPLDGPDAFTVMKAQVEQVPEPPALLQPELPPRLNGAILQALSKDPGRRFQAAEDFLFQLEAVRIQMEPERWKGKRISRLAEPRKHLRVAWLTAAVTAALSSLWFGYSQYRHAKVVLEAPAPRLPASALLTPPGPPAGALTPPSPPAVETQVAAARAAPPPGKPRGVRAETPARPVEPRRLEPAAPRVHHAAPAAPKPIIATLPPPTPTPPLAASAPDDPQESRLEEAVAEPPQEVRKPGAVRRFLGKLNPLRLRRKPTDKPVEGEPQEQQP